ncbi:MAG TPA: DUF2190 family protein [Burkholderiaceae bacterium]|nr:DUF2190 family protein [Burkholderiaceae bacterium]
MKNFVQPGDTITLPAPAALSSGDAVLVGTAFGVACGDAASGAAVEVKTTGVFDLKAASAATAAVGAAAYWDNTGKEVNATASGNTKIGVFLAAKTNGQTTARVRLNGAF